MASISMSDKSYAEIENIAFARRTTRKDVADKMVTFISKNDGRMAAFLKEMF